MNCGFCGKSITLYTEPTSSFTIFDRIPYHRACADKLENNSRIDSFSDESLINKTDDGLIQHKQQRKPSKRRGSFWSHSILNCEKCGRPKANHTTQQVKECMSA